MCGFEQQRSIDLADQCKPIKALISLNPFVLGLEYCIK